MGDKRPRRFFSLLCAHKWENIGVGSKSNGFNRKEFVVQQCEHCGELRRWQ